MEEMKYSNDKRGVASFTGRHPHSPESTSGDEPPHAPTLSPPRGPSRQDDDDDDDGKRKKRKEKEKQTKVFLWLRF